MASLVLRRVARIPTPEVFLLRSYSTTQPVHNIRSPLYETPTLHLPRPDPLNIQFNSGLEVRANGKNLDGTIRFWNNMTAKGIKPNQKSYLTLLTLMAEYRLLDPALKVFRDMSALSVGGGLKAMNLVLLSAVENMADFTRILAMFPQHALVPDVITYQYYLTALDNADNLERALQLLEEMSKVGVIPNKQSIRTVVLMAARMGMPTLAMELTINSSDILGRADDELHMIILMSAASCMNLKVTRWAYDLVTSAKIPLTEPLCVNILNLAQRHGEPHYAVYIMEVLHREHIPIQEYHLAPLIGACCAAGRVRDAFLALGKFTEFGVELLPESTDSLVNLIGKDTAKLDEAYDILLGLPKPVNIHTVNATLKAAAIVLSDLPRAIGIYKDLTTLGCTPTTETYDILLAGCLKVSHVALGNKLYADMLALNLEPSEQTYTRLILLALTSEESYEDAFERLEDMKEKNMTPPLVAYEALVTRLVKENDPRADLALEDMASCGYGVNPQLRDFLLRSSHPAGENMGRRPGKRDGEYKRDGGRSPGAGQRKGGQTVTRATGQVLSQGP